MKRRFALVACVYYSRSRRKLWRKGEESGNVQELKALYFDCDADTLLVKVHQMAALPVMKVSEVASFVASICHTFSNRGRRPSF